MSEVIDTANNNNEDTNGIALMQFPKEVLSRLQPDLVLQRHLHLGLRPSTLMKFNEFRNVEEQSNDSLIVNHSTASQDQDNTNSNNSGDLIVANNLLKVGNMFIKTDLSLGITAVETANIDEESFAPIWPEVTVDRGRMGAPTDEEMIASRQLYENIISGKYIKQKDLIISKIGKKHLESEEISYDMADDDDDNDELLLENKNKWCFVIYAKINVYSREGPIYDHVFNSLMLALQKLKFPSVYIEESSIDLQISSKKSFNRKQKQETKRTFNMKFDFGACNKLSLNSDIAISSNFGVIYKDPTMAINALDEQETNEEKEEDAMDIEKENTDFKKEPILINDISTDIEEQAILSKVSISCNSKNYKSIKLMNGSNNEKISVQQLKQALKFSKMRYEDLKPTI
ncbi:hypothetical protein ACO0SA_002484 [Hanseniaspora valbyensis]